MALPETTLVSANLSSAFPVALVPLLLLTRRTPEVVFRATFIVERALKSASVVFAVPVPPTRKVFPVFVRLV